MGGALAWYDYSGGVCPWTINGKQWPCIVGDVLTAMDFICWYTLEIPGADHRSLFCGSLFVAARQMSKAVVLVAVQEEKMEVKKETQADPQAVVGAQV